MSATTEKPSNKYVVDFHNMEKKPTIGKTSTGEGASFNGERIYCGLVTKKKGTGSNRIIIRTRLSITCWRAP